jgi:hypothetical protein
VSGAIDSIMQEFMGSVPVAITESAKTKAKKLLKTNKMAQGKDEHARGMRAYLRAVASGRDAAYLLTQKGKMGAGAKHASKILGEARRRMIPRGLAKGALGVTGQSILNIIRPHGSLSEAKILSAMKKAPGLSFMSAKGHKNWLKKLEDMGRLVKKGSTWSMPVTEDFTAAELDSWWSGARAKLIKGSRATRHSRMAGCVKSLRALRDGGIKVSGLSQTDKNPVPRRERDSEDQPVDSTPGKVDEEITIEETTMNLNDAIARFRSLDEANIPAPGVSRTLPDGGNQFSSKSKFKYYGGADQDYQGGSISIPTDAPAKAAMSHSSNVKGPVGADAREVVDVRIEDVDPDQLVAMLEQIAEAADSLEEYAQLIENHLGFDMVVEAFKVVGNVDNPELLLGRIYEEITNPQTGDGPVVNNPMSEANRGVGTDDFVENSSHAADMAFAEGMMRGETTDAGLSGIQQEANIPAPAPSNTGPDGKAQIASKSRFRKYYPGPGQTNTGAAAPIQPDPETHAAMSHSAAAGGPGYTPDKREETDVRVEGQQFLPKPDGSRPPEPANPNELDAFAASMSYPDTLIKK